MKRKSTTKNINPSLKKFVSKNNIITFFFVLFLLVFVSLGRPSNNRNWAPEYERITNASVRNTTVTLRNVRDFHYIPGQIASTGYKDREFDIETLEQVWFIFEPFGNFEPVAHTYFVFDFEGQAPIAMSAEARREIGEDYSPFDLLLSSINKYELVYQWGSETDLTIKRVLIDEEKLHMLPLKISKDGMKKLFMELVKKTDKLENDPEFYNLLLRSCNNELAKAGNKVKPGSIPFHYAVTFPGYSAKLLYKLGFLPKDSSYEDMLNKYYISDFIRENYSKENFSQLLREKIK